MRHREAEVIPDAVLADALARTPLDHYVIWTGRDPAVQSGSLRSRAFACVCEVGAPVSLRTLMQRASKLDGQAGLHPDAVRSAVRLHQQAKPAVLLLVERRPSGDYVAVADIPFAGALNRRFSAGEVVLDRQGARRFDTLADAA
ncbi:hypothetical protein [Phenylobacterium hankyongense]|uniref:hypothetical protein n=1 Tax=Phenylobacterium hankyongense TaxID=1813876 RepID=UPI001057A255|nr:hypothetical protein [Phenylobacterium hankyongense]